LVAALLGVGIWTLTRPCIGLKNDGALYTMMALNWAKPAVLSSDLFLRFGSQDPFTIFSPLYGSLIRQFGIAGANIGFLISAHVLWLVGAWLLTHRLVRGLPGHFAFLVVAAIQATYGGWSLLYSGEDFLTPRPFAEAWVMIGLAMLLSRAYVRATAALILAALFHPAMALAGIGAAFISFGLRRHAALWLVPVGASAIALLAVTHVEPIGRLLQLMDPAWLAGVQARDAFVLTGNWMPEDWVRIAVDLASCICAALWSGGERRRLFIAVSLTAVVGMVFSVVAADLAHDVLAVQLQTWRLTWPLAVAKFPALIVIWLRLRRRPLGHLVTVLLTAPTLVFTGPMQFPAWSWGPCLIFSVAGLSIASLIRFGREPHLSRTQIRLIIGSAAILPLLNLEVGIVLALNLRSLVLHNGTPSVGAMSAMSEPPVRLTLLACATVMLWLARRHGRIAVILSALTIIPGAMFWDQRSSWERYVTSDASSPLRTELGAGREVLWFREAASTWFLLRRPAYLTTTQASSLLLSRAASLEWMRRRDFVWPLLPIRDWTLAPQTQSCAELQRPISIVEMTSICRRSAGLGGVITDRNPVGARTLRFSTPVPYDRFCDSRGRVETVRTNQFYFFDCKIPGRLGKVPPAGNPGMDRGLPARYPPKEAILTRMPG
jgi:hypothetical protein